MPRSFDEAFWCENSGLHALALGARLNDAAVELSLRRAGGDIVIQVLDRRGDVRLVTVA